MGAPVFVTPTTLSLNTPLPPSKPTHRPSTLKVRLLELMFAALVRAAERWRGLRFTEFELRQIAAVRKDLHAEYEATITRSDRPSQTRVSSRSAP
jgi:hypothetical protein